jgi:hypothetical protein
MHVISTPNLLCYVLATAEKNSSITNKYPFCKPTAIKNPSLEYSTTFAPTSSFANLIYFLYYEFQTAKTLSYPTVINSYLFGWKDRPLRERSK